ncbi:MAG: aspartate-semialdehyde dehydrogenase [Clostridium sp.]|nr:aspartate-semialdehyde dehydrogenase [Clostridium sp.]
MYNVAIVGATGNVGRKFLEILEQRDFPVKNLYLFASKRSAGTTLQFKGKDFIVEETCDENIVNKKIDFALFSNPNCSTIQAMPVLNAIHKKYGIKRIVYSTYQAVSGAGIQGIKDLEDGYKGIEPKKFPYPITGNVLPHIDVFEENGYTKEEMKMINETRKILHDDTLKITATTARVAVLNSHSESINLELQNEFELDDIVNLLSNTEGVVVYDNTKELKYPTPLFVTGKDDIYVGRIRRDFSVDNGLNLWVVADNIRKGAALNAIQIAELMIDKK